MSVCVYAGLCSLCAYADPREPAGACLCEGGKEGGNEQERKRSEASLCVMESCESELLAVRSSACLSVRSIQAEKIRTCRSY